MNEHAEVLSSYQKAFGGSGQIAHIWRIMLANIARRVPVDRSAEDLESIVVRAKDALYSIHYALRGDGFDSKTLKEPGRIWAKAKLSPDLIGATQMELMEKFNFRGQGSIFGDSNMLEDSIEEYLAVPEAQTDWLHWLLVDQILFAELIAFQEFVVTADENMVPDWSMQMAVIRKDRKRAISSLRTRRAVFTIIGSLLSDVAYIGLTYLAIRFKASLADWFRVSEDFAWVIVGFIGISYWAKLVGTGSAQANIPSRKKKSMKLLGEMERLYRLWSWPILNPSYFREELRKVTANGAVYWATLPILLDQCISANPVLFRAHLPRDTWE